MPFTIAIRRGNRMPPLKNGRVPSCALKEKSKANHEDKTKVSESLDATKQDEKSTEWRNNAKGLRQINAFALENKILTDVTFSVGPEAKEIHAHRLILALGSPVFEAMFYGGLAEKENVIAIPDVTPEGFQCLLRYLYTETITFHHDTEAFEACIAADKYCVPHLKEECEEYIAMTELTPDNVWVFLDNSLLLNLKTITDKCLEFLTAFTKASLQSNGFLDASKEAIEHLLKLETMDIKEIKLLKSIIHWAEEKTVGEKTFEEVLHPLICHIRFGVLTPNEFCSFLEESGSFLKDADALAILKHLVKPLSIALPEWCCSKSWRNLHTHSMDCCDHSRSFGEFWSSSSSRSRSRNTSRTRHRSRSRSISRRNNNLNSLRRNRSRSPRSRSITRHKIMRLNEETTSDSSSSSSTSSSSSSTTSTLTDVD